MVEGTADTRGEAVREFAVRLRELRAADGQPSFRELAGRSQAISHTTLHEAAQGNRLPSWSTTVEFVKACGGDPAGFRADWQRADAAVRAASRPAAAAPDALTSPTGPTGRADVAADVVPEPPAAAPVTDPTTTPDAVAPAGPSRRRRRGAWAVTGASVAVVAAATVFVVTGSDRAAPGATPAPTATSADDCPLQQTEPPSAPSATDGDRAVFISDITLPDCSRVGVGETVVKTWRFKNVGSVPWIGYSLHRIDLPETRDQCQTITDIAIPDTAPGAMVDVSADVTAPTRAGFCFVRFKFETADGRVAFPGSRPVNFQLVVA